jgi:hypothetical protein
VYVCVCVCVCVYVLNIYLFTISLFTVLITAWCMFVCIHLIHTYNI